MKGRIGEVPFSPRLCEAMSRLLSLIKENHDPQKLLAAIPDQLRHFLEFDALAVGRINSDGGVDLVMAEYDPTPQVTVPKSYSYLGGFTEWVLSNQQPLLISNSLDETRFENSVHLLRQFGLKTVCVLPLYTFHRQIGSFSVACKRQSAYGTDHLHFLSLISGQIAIAMDNAIHSAEVKQAQRDLESRNKRLRLLLDISNAFASCADVDGLLDDISSVLRESLHCDSATVSILEHSSGKLLLPRSNSKNVADSSDSQFALQDKLQSIFRSNKPVSAFGGQAEKWPLTQGFSAECHLPLNFAGRSLGVLSLGRKHDTPFTEEVMEFLVSVAHQVAIALDNCLGYSEIRVLRDQLAAEKIYLQDEIRSESNFDEIIGKSEALKAVLSQLEVVAPTDTTVLICGDTGTGKELIARAIHNLSPRSGSAFVKLNCAAIPTGLLESELFGHEKGAFTGAVSQRLGRFEIANRGTVFLDEVGEIPLELQPKLLRVLQEREFERLGSSKTLTTDARLVAATNRDLKKLVEQNLFRSDLFYRLNVFPLQIPRLNQRKEDIPMLVRHFVRHFCSRMNKVVDTIPSEAMNAIVNYPWPGNIRELQNFLERSVILSTGPVLKVQTSELLLTQKAASDTNIDTLASTERKHILNVLERTDWTIAGSRGAAALLGMKRTTLQSKMLRLGIHRP